MISLEKNVFEYPKDKDVFEYHFGVVISEWHREVTESMFEGTVNAITSMGGDHEKIVRLNVPGSFELAMGAQHLTRKDQINAVICLGCVIQGETRHFDFICQSVAQGITAVGLKSNKPVTFGVLTTNTLQQALDRSGGKHGNKGDEAGVTAVKMLATLKGFNERFRPL